MAAQETIEKHTRAVMEKAEETIRELEDAVQSMPRSSERNVSPWLLGAALGSIAFALTLYARKRKDDAMFVGLWAPTFLGLSLFKDLLKMPRKAR